MTLPLASRIALVTGASRGIGRATALALARAGAHVVAVARTVGALEELDDAVRAAGSTATLVPLDLKDYDGIDRLAAALNERYGRLDILIGNAGILGPLSPIDHVPPADWDNVMAVNVTANYRLLRACVGLLKASDAGRAVFMTSGVAHQARAYWGPYAVSKAAVDVLVRTVAAETVNTPVRINAFSPGLVGTRMLATAFPGLDLETVASPDSIGDAIVPLCLPSVTETGCCYSMTEKKFLQFSPPH